MTLEQFLFSQGHGTRRVCAGLIAQQKVRIGALEPGAIEGMHYQVCDAQGRWVDWAYHAQAVILLHKPAGYECSHKPSAWPSVYTLMPAALRARPTKGVIQGVQAVGRLDQDTTGALLLTDDGALVHRLSSPKHHVPKVYELGCRHPVSDSQISALLSGVVLHDDPMPVRASACERMGNACDSHGLRLTLTQGKYHQVKRMLAAVGNRVESLHRSRIGPIGLADLAMGQWRWLTSQEVADLRGDSGKLPHNAS